MAELTVKPDMTSLSRGFNAVDVRTVSSFREDATVATSGQRAVPSIGTLMAIKRKVAKWRSRRENLGSTKSSTAIQGPRVRMENSYVLGPKDEERFNEERVGRIISEVLMFHLADTKTYDSKHCARLACTMTEQIKSRVKELRYTRYKIVAYVVVGKANGQGTHVASRGLWDTAYDGMASVKITSQNMFAVGVVFATYFE